MNLTEILQNPAFQSVQVIAGHNGLDKEMKNITMMDAPDIIEYLHPNDFLVTTAYHYKDEPLKLLPLIKSMYEQECAALGIKTQRFITTIPDEVIEFANKHQFPLVEIPLETSLGEMVNATLNYMLSQRTAELTSAFETHRRFTQYILKGKGWRRLVEDLSHMIGKRIVLLDAHFQVHSSSYTRQSISKFFIELHGKGFDFLLGNSLYTCFTTRNTEEVFSVFPIHTHMGKPAYLIVLGEVSFEDQRLLLTIEQATNVLSFELMRENTIKQYSRRAKNEFFSHFVEGKFTFPEEIENRASEFLLKKEQASITIVGKMDTLNLAQKPFSKYSIEIDYMYEFLEAEMTKAPYPSQLFVKEDHCIIIMAVSQPNDEMEQHVLPYLKEIQAYMEKIFKISISFGISNVFQRLLHIPNAYREGLSALQTGQLSGNTPFIQLHRPKDVSEMLRIIPTKDLQEFYEHILLELTNDLHQEEEQILLNTLAVYLETHCQISETAKRLYVHRNTVIYRLEKCEEILGKSLKDPDTTFHLRLALRIKSILQTNDRKIESKASHYLL